MVEWALTSCEFRQLKQVLQLSGELPQKARDGIRGMMGVKESLRGVDSRRCQGHVGSLLKAANQRLLNKLKLQHVL